MTEYGQAVVLEAGEITTRTLDALDAQVEPFGGGRMVGDSDAVVVQDLVLPALGCVAERADLCDLVALAAEDGLAKQYERLADPLGQVTSRTDSYALARRRVTRRRGGSPAQPSGLAEAGRSMSTTHANP